jgi:putative sterol carrier protein
MATIKELGYRKVGATWVPKMLKTAPKNIRAKLQQRGEKNADAFLSRIITGDDTWVQRYDPPTKRKSLELHRQVSQHKEKIHGTDFFG